MSKAFSSEMIFMKIMFKIFFNVTRRPAEWNLSHENMPGENRISSTLLPKLHLVYTKVNLIF